MNILQDAMPAVMDVISSLPADDQVRIAKAMDAAVIFGALQERAGTGGFKQADTSALETAYWQRVNQVR